MTEALILAVAILGYGLWSRSLQSSPLTAPMIFTGIGVLVGPAALGWFDLAPGSEATTVLVEATLVIVLFSDAVRIDLGALRHEASLPARMLGVGMPATVVLGTLAAWALFDLSWAEAALLAAVLAPTDAALGRAVVSDERLPVRIRQALNVESGLNDGIALPLVTVLLALNVAEEEGERDAASWVGFATEQIGFGGLVGLVVGAGAGYVITKQSAAGRIDGVYRQLGTLATAVAAYAGAESIGGNGFVAAFVAGAAFGAVTPTTEVDVADFSEDEGELLTVITFTLFGAVLLGPSLGDFTMAMLAYALLSLTVVRMVPVGLSLVRSRTLVETRLFLGWFGPRGLASILFAVLVADELTGAASDLIVGTATLTVALSVLAHGMTASAWTGRLSRRIGEVAAGIEEGPEAMAEHQDFPEMPVRRRMG